ncbi:hypothetical protein [Escherichia albertii]|uniref:hypothetical protein n=1 Tax=Escherichia albertii TaxID=208962 RepID=UPI000BF41C89|nr:hypothetical protein [Escherichia albertii]PFF96626.1 hypothetical protein CRH02_06785 [Escherichia albertii]
MLNIHITEVEIQGLYRYKNLRSGNDRTTFTFNEYTELLGEYSKDILRLIYLGIINTEESKKEIKFICQELKGVILIKRDDLILTKIIISDDVHIDNNINVSCVYITNSDIVRVKSTEQANKNVETYADFIKEFPLTQESRKIAKVWTKAKIDNEFVDLIFWEDINYQVEHGDSMREFIDYLKNKGTQIISTLSQIKYETFLIETQVKTDNLISNQ